MDSSLKDEIRQQVKGLRKLFLKVINFKKEIFLNKKDSYENSLILEEEIKSEIKKNNTLDKKILDSLKKGELPEHERNQLFLKYYRWELPLILEHLEVLLEKISFGFPLEKILHDIEKTHASLIHLYEGLFYGTYHYEEFFSLKNDLDFLYDLSKKESKVPVEEDWEKYSNNERDKNISSNPAF